MHQMEAVSVRFLQLKNFSLLGQTFTQKTTFPDDYLETTNYADSCFKECTGRPFMRKNQVGATLIIVLLLLVAITLIGSLAHSFECAFFKGLDDESGTAAAASELRCCII